MSEGKPARLSRRDLLGTVGLVSLVAPLLESCDAALPVSCTSVTELTKGERSARDKLEYVDASPHRDKRCNGCTQWVAPGKEGQCGSCKVMKGPVHPHGYCRVFASAG